MKSFFKFIGLTVITLGLYIPYLILRRIFGGSKKGGKLPKDWKFYGHIVLMPAAQIGTTEKSVSKTLLKMFPDLSTKEIQKLLEQLHEDGRCRIGLSEKEFKQAGRDSFNGLVIVERRGKNCCSPGEYENSNCNCGITCSVEEMTGRGILDAGEVWARGNIY